MFLSSAHAPFKNEHNEFDKDNTCRSIFNALFPSKECTARHTFTETYMDLSSQKITKQSIQEKIALAREKNPNLFKSNHDENIFFFNLVQECYSKLISYNKSLDHNNLEELLEIIVLDYLSLSDIDDITKLETIAQEIFELQIKPLARITSASNKNTSSHKQKSNKEEISNFVNPINTAKELIIKGQYEGLVTIENNYTLPAILVLMYFDENNFIKLLDDANVKNLFSTQNLFKDVYDRTLLHHAVLKGKYNIIDKIFQILDKSELKSLSKCVDEYGRTALHLAASNNQLEIVEFFVENYPDLITAKDDYGRTALHLAIINNRVEVARECIEKYEELLDITDTNNNTALHLAAMTGSIDILKLLGYEYLYSYQLNKINDSGSTALHQAAYWKHPKAIDVLIESGADVNIADKQGCKPLIVAMKISDNFPTNFLKTSKEIISKLINYDYSIFVPVIGKFNFSHVDSAIKKEQQYLNEDCINFVKKLFELLSQNSDIFEPLLSNSQDHIPLITKAINASNKELIQKIMSNFSELLDLSEVQQNQLRESIINSQLHKDNDEIMISLWDKYDFDKTSKISNEDYTIFKANEYGNSAVSNLIESEKYDELIELLKEKNLLVKLNIHNENTNEILKQIILFTCSDSFKSCSSYEINDAKSLYNSISHILYINGDLDSEVFLAGAEILETNLWSE